MAIKIYKRNTAGRRNMSVIKPDGLTDQKPEKRLTKALHRFFGRSRGKISVRHKGGGHKRRYRLVDFRQVRKLGIPGTVVSLEKDPNRSSLIALIQYQDGEKGYILATHGMQVGQTVLSAERAPIATGNRLKIAHIPAGTQICNIELLPGKGGQLVRSAGSAATLMALDGEFGQVKLASGEIRLVRQECYATIGQVSNFEHNNRVIGKAGRARHMGRRPSVRGSAMNPVDHPHGGGEGAQPLGMHPKTPWGKPALGKKTRRRKNKSNQYILKRRK